MGGPRAWDGPPGVGRQVLDEIEWVLLYPVCFEVDERGWVDTGVVRYSECSAARHLVSGCLLVHGCFESFPFGLSIAVCFFDMGVYKINGKAHFV